MNTYPTTTDIVLEEPFLVLNYDDWELANYGVNEIVKHSCNGFTKPAAKSLCQKQQTEDTSPCSSSSSTDNNNLGADMFSTLDLSLNPATNILPTTKKTKTKKATRADMKWMWRGIHKNARNQLVEVKNIHKKKDRPYDSFLFMLVNNKNTQ